SRVLPSLCAKAFTNENDRRHRVPVTQLTGRIYEQTIEEWVRRRDLAAQGDVKAHPFNLAPHLTGAFGMTRSKHEQKIDKIALQSAKDLGQEFFFSTVGASTENHRSPLQSETGKN